MAVNRAKGPDGTRIDYTNDTGSAIKSGDAVMIGNIPGVATVDIADGEVGVVEIASVPVYKLDVKGEDGTGNHAVAIGDKVYMDSGVLNIDSANGTLYGYALEAVVSGATTEIKVALAI